MLELENLNELEILSSVSRFVANYILTVVEMDGII